MSAAHSQYANHTTTGNVVTAIKSITKYASFSIHTENEQGAQLLQDHPTQGQQEQQAHITVLTIPIDDRAALMSQLSINP